MNNYYAVLLDTVSIQSYIFQSNKLKDNIGASHLVREIYQSYLAYALCQITKRSYQEELLHLNDWKQPDADDIPNKTKPVVIGYIGGGNALLFFYDHDDAKNLIRSWTKKLLIYAPGLATAVALSPFDFSKFRQDIDKLIKQLRENKDKYIPITLLPRHGITAECSRTGNSAEIRNNDIEEYVSADANARIEAAVESKKEIEQEYVHVLKETYCFSNDLEKLGGIKQEDSRIAIVHIDGNDIGKLFEKAHSLKDIRKLSKNVRKAIKDTFKKIIEDTVKRYEDIMKSLGFDNSEDYPMADKKRILPIRSIILDGDDITFVCDGKLGIYFAKKIIEKFEETDIDGENLTACAGVAIIKTKYPFYRGYLLAEELCVNAKKEREVSASSLLDFHIALGGISGKLNKIRQTHYELVHGSLMYRPLVINPNKKGVRSLDLLLEKALLLKEKFPKNKIYELRETLRLSKDARCKFVMSLKYRDLKLPEIAGIRYDDSLFDGGKTPYFDMIEIMRFYPDFALKESGGTHE